MYIGLHWYCAAKKGVFLERFYEFGQCRTIAVLNWQYHFMKPGVLYCGILETNNK